MSPEADTDYNVIVMRIDLRPFHSIYAATVASWVHTDRDLLWLAPRTLPPLTPEKVFAWDGPRNNLFLLHRAAGADPIGYAEINELEKRPNHLWLGHIIIDPAHRSRGLGTEFVGMLLKEAFDVFAAHTVSLVVFRDNIPAARCYLNVGFVSAGEEIHRFHTNGRRYRMLRMDITLAQWMSLRTRTGATMEPA